MTYAPIATSHAATEDCNESGTRSRGRKTLVAVVGLTLLITVGVVGVSSSRRSQLRSTSKEGLESTMSAAGLAQCGAVAPPRLQLKINNATPMSSSCVLPSFIEGVWTLSAPVERGDVKSVTYTKMPDTTLDMYLNSCGYGSKHANQYDCVSRWVVTDPTQLSRATWTNGVPTSIIQSEVCANKLEGLDFALAPPLGPATWEITCANGQRKKVEILLTSAQAVVEGQWSRQKCVSGPGSVSVPMDVTAAAGKPLGMKDVKTDMANQFKKGMSVSAKGISDAMVSTMTTQFLADLKYAKPGQKQLPVQPANGNVCLWVWKWSIHGFVSAGDIMAPPMELFSHSLTALTSNADVVPKCLPGFATDPSYQTCDSEEHQIPLTTLTAQEDLIQKSVR